MKFLAILILLGAFLFMVAAIEVEQQQQAASGIVQASQALAVGDAVLVSDHRTSDEKDFWLAFRMRNTSVKIARLAETVVAVDAKDVVASTVVAVVRPIAAEEKPPVEDGRLIVGDVDVVTAAKSRCPLIYKDNRAIVILFFNKKHLTLLQKYPNQRILCHWPKQGIMNLLNTQLRLPVTSKNVNLLFFKLNRLDRPGNSRGRPEFRLAGFDVSRNERLLYFGKMDVFSCTKKNSTHLVIVFL